VGGPATFFIFPPPHRPQHRPLILSVSGRSAHFWTEPTVTNGVVTFFVQLNPRAHTLLRPNLRVEVFVITPAGRPADYLAVAPGPRAPGGRRCAATGTGTHQYREVGLTMIRDILLNHGFPFSLATDEEGITAFRISF
jgi:hypothetical protein